MSNKTNQYKELVTLQCTMLKLPLPVSEYRFHTERRWRFDFAWPDNKVALEIEGGAYSTSRMGHSTGVGIHQDMIKYNEAAILGWKVIRCIPEELKLKSGVAINLIERALQGWKVPGLKSCQEQTENI